MQIPGYSIIHKINTGGMSSVFVATQNSVGRKVALKIMNPALDKDPEFHQRFQREANIVGQLSHPHIIPIYDIGRHHGLNYISMEFMPNGSLEDKIKQGIKIEQAVQITLQIAAALGHAHNKGYVHRDIKPDNILFRDYNSAVLTDFGIARAIKSDNKMTQAGSVIGTPYYMSPEQAAGEPTDARSDLYSLGVVFYEMLTGNKLFDSDSAVTLGIKHIHEQPAPLPAELAFLQPVLDKLIAKKPEDRYQTANELINALSHFTGNYIAEKYQAPEQKNTRQLFMQNYRLITNIAKKFIYQKFLSQDNFNKNTKIATQIYSSDEVKAEPKFNKRFVIYAILLVAFVITALQLYPSQKPESITDKWLQISADQTEPEELLPLNITTEPETAYIRFLDLNRNYQPGMQLPAGAYHVEISSPGYLTKTQWIRLNQNTSFFEIKLVNQQNSNNMLILPDMVLIKKGTFLMGSKQTARQVSINKNFYISRYEVTFNEYDFFATETNRALPDDNGWGRGDKPVINITWDDALAYTHWLTKTTGKIYRLPDAAEWEYAARGNTTSDYWWGNDPDGAYNRANCRSGCTGWWKFLSANKTQIVGSFPPNDFGLYNTAGNVAEWTVDCADSDYNAGILSPCIKRVVRGGSYSSKVKNITSFAQTEVSSNQARNNLGMRVVREVSSRFDDPTQDAARPRNIFRDIKNSLFNSRQNPEVE